MLISRYCEMAPNALKFFENVKVKQMRFTGADILKTKMNKKTEKFPVNLFCSLMLLSFIPFLYTLVRTNLIVNSPSTDGLGIAGHIEWFDLINEAICVVCCA